jgi:hypothetical protein
MDFTLPASLALAAFWSRDWALVSRRRALRWSYPLIVSATWLACAALGERLSKNELNSLLTRRETWMAALLVHGGLAILAYRWRDQADRFGWLVLLPTPVLLTSALHTAWFVLGRWNNLNHWIAGAVLAACWLVPMILLASLRAARPDTARALIAGTNLTALLLLPFGGPPNDSSGAATPVDAIRAAVPLGLTLIMIAASYLVHRARQFTWKGKS